MKAFATYIWSDGTTPTARLRSKIRGVDVGHQYKESGPTGGPPQFSIPKVEAFPVWAFDGSSTNQASGGDSDLLLKPIKVIADPTRNSTYLVLCEVFYPNKKAHESNTRATLRQTLQKIPVEAEPWVGFEQEYTMYSEGRPLGWPENGDPPAQGPYYCSVGAETAYGRPLSSAHMKACSEANLSICGSNAEVMIGQWEYQIGGPKVNLLTSCDDLILSRWLLECLGEYASPSITISYDPKPVKGDWNGAGCHTNFSTSAMRSEGGLDLIKDACESLGEDVEELLSNYGHDYESRLTGAHETCRYDEFKWGIGDRTASVRIPTAVAMDGYGYLEDRRPNANCDPYQVCNAILNRTKKHILSYNQSSNLFNR